MSEGSASALRAAELHVIFAIILEKREGRGPLAKLYVMMNIS